MTPLEPGTLGSNASSTGNRFPTGTLSVAIYFSLAGLLIHLLANGQYGYFRDELYFLAETEHLDWGYVDHAPLIALIAKLSRTLLGDSLRAIRFFPALASAATILLTGLIARELGGKRFAVALACLSLLVAPMFLAMGTLMTMNVFEGVFWTGCAYALLLALKRENPKILLWLGLLAGLGLQNKHSMAFFMVALFAGLLLTRDRRLLLNKWLWIAAATAFVIILPNVIWQYQRGWPTWEVLRNVSETGKNVVLSPTVFMKQLTMSMLPTTALVWVAGFWYFLLDTEGRRFRALGWAFVVVLSLMIALKAKLYYVLPAYPMLFAAGGVFWEKLSDRRRRLRWVKVALPVLILVPGVITMPVALPVFPVETYVGYTDAIGFSPPKSEVKHEGKLPQMFGDMFGWPEMVKQVAEVYHALPPEERSKAAIFADNYGEAGAIDFFGPQYGLPKAICPHQNYFNWGYREYTGEVVIVLNGDRTEAEQLFDSVETAGDVYHPYGMTYENYTILVCRGLRVPLEQLWPTLKVWR